MFEVVFYLDNVCGLEVTFVQHAFLHWLVRWPEIKSMSLKIHSSSAYLPQSRGFIAFQLYIFFPSNTLCGLAQFRFEPSSKKPKSRKALCKTHVYAALYILSNAGNFTHKHQSQFYEMTHQLLSKYDKLKGKNWENTKWRNASPEVYVRRWSQHIDQLYGANICRVPTLDISTVVARCLEEHKCEQDSRPSLRKIIFQSWRLCSPWEFITSNFKLSITKKITVWSLSEGKKKLIL